MIQSNQGEPLYRARMLPKDLGVAIVVLVALTLGLGMRFQVEGRVKQFQDGTVPRLKKGGSGKDRVGGNHQTRFGIGTRNLCFDEIE